MIVITGGAGFIGSATVNALNRRGIDDILIVDHLGSSEKWKNLVSLRYTDYMDKSQFIKNLEDDRFGDSITTIFHFGACSSTTETNADYLMENNFRYTVKIGQWWDNHRNTRFIYASSAATYGDGSHGYSDDIAQLDQLRPLNMYGYSKHLFDLYAFHHKWLDRAVGLKFFNVFGPNEYHKNDMRSVINKAFPTARDHGLITLFKSHRSGYNDGEQKRDFIYVKDAVAMTLFFMDNPGIGGIFNVGTGHARSWNDVAKSLFSALDKEPIISYIDMPAVLQGKYQYFTEASLLGIRRAGCLHECRTLEESIDDYVRSYLVKGNHLEREPYSIS